MAWTALFHALFYRKGKRPWYRKPGSAGTGVRYVKIDGDPKHWELSECLKQHYGDKNPPERRNLEFLIGLRNKIEHRQMIDEVPCARTTSIEISSVRASSATSVPARTASTMAKLCAVALFDISTECPDESDEAPWPSRATTKLFDDLNPQPQAEIFSLRSPELRPQLLLVPLPQDVDVKTRATGKRHNVLAIAIDVAAQLGKYEVVALEHLQT
jgi:hypothetical protein